MSSLGTSRLPCGDCISWTETLARTSEPMVDETTGTCECPDSPHFEETRLATDDGCEFALTWEDVGAGVDDYTYEDLT